MAKQSPETDLRDDAIALAQSNWDRLPVSIPFPEINRPYRAGIEPLNRVQQVTDLPSRLFFGDLVADSFQQAHDGWSVEYRDRNGNGVDLQVSEERFKLRPFFMGTDVRCFGNAAQSGALGQYLCGSGGRAWDQVLKTNLEAKYPLTVLTADDRQPSACMIPDGWLWTILVPVRVERLNNLLFFHNKLNTADEIGASVRGSVRLQLGNVEYYEFEYDDEKGERGPFDEPMRLLVHHLHELQTPVFDEPTKETKPDGNTVWRLQRQAYLYRCTCFLRDLPSVLIRLFYGNFLSREPDLRAAVVHTESLLTAESLSWWSPKCECRNTWTNFAPGELLGRPQTEAAHTETQAAVSEVFQASREYLVALGFADGR